MGRCKVADLYRRGMNNIHEFGKNNNVNTYLHY